MLKLIGKLFEFEFGDGVLIGFLLGVSATLIAHWYLYPPTKEDDKP